MFMFEFVFDIYLNLYFIYMCIYRYILYTFTVCIHMCSIVQTAIDSRTFWVKISPSFTKVAKAVPHTSEVATISAGIFTQIPGKTLVP